MNLNSNETFQNIEEHPSDTSFDTPNEISSLLNEELSGIPSLKDFLSHADPNQGISKVLVSKISSLKSLKTLLTAEELEDFLNIGQFISKAEEFNENPLMDLDYIEKSRKQQELIVKILRKISDLQWEVEDIYLKTKEKEEKKVSGLEESACSLDSIGRRVNCTCFII